MESIQVFADGGFTSGDIRWEPYLERTIVRYIESKTVMRNFCFIYPLQPNTFVARIPRNYATGLAAEVAEGTEIPVVRQVTDTFDVSVIKYGTGAEMTDEAKETDWLGILGQAQIEEAALRMLRKENSDILAVLLAGCGHSGNSSEAGKLKYEDIVLAQTYMINQLRNPNIIIVNADQYADLRVDQRFTDASASGTTATLREGNVGRVAGLDLVILPEMPTGTAILMDQSLNPLWLVVRQGMRIGRYRNERRQIDGFVVTAWAKPVMVRPDCCYKITNC
jgi:HK97 family phage major capsid protein